MCSANQRAPCWRPIVTAAAPITERWKAGCRRYRFRREDQRGPGDDQHKASRGLPTNGFAQVGNRKRHQHTQRQHFLDGLNCAAVYAACPQRLAGTCRQYSKKAIPQLIRITVHNAVCWYRRRPYQATVIKTLEANSRIGVSHHDHVVSASRKRASYIRWWMRSSWPSTNCTPRCSPPVRATRAARLITVS